MKHLSIYTNPREHGLTPYHVAFRRAESRPLPSMLDEGVVYRHPERTENAVVWAQNAQAIPDVLTYHYRGSWSDLEILQIHRERRR
jgi:hypothetical protein